MPPAATCGVGRQFNPTGGAVGVTTIMKMNLLNQTYLSDP